MVSTEKVSPCLFARDTFQKRQNLNGEMNGEAKYCFLTGALIRQVLRF